MDFVVLEKVQNLMLIVNTFNTFINIFWKYLDLRLDEDKERYKLTY